MGAPSPIEAVLTLGKYSLLEKIGEGYLGSVYRALIRVLTGLLRCGFCATASNGSQNREHLQSQCRAIAALNHPGIASIIDVGKHGPRHFSPWNPWGEPAFKA